MDFSILQSPALLRRHFLLSQKMIIKNSEIFYFPNFILFQYNYKIHSAHLIFLMTLVPNSFKLLLSYMAYYGYLSLLINRPLSNLFLSSNFGNIINKFTSHLFWSIQLFSVHEYIVHYTHFYVYTFHDDHWGKFANSKQMRFQLF